MKRNGMRCRVVGHGTPRRLRARFVLSAALFALFGPTGCSEAPNAPEAVPAPVATATSPFPLVDLEGLKRRIGDLEGSVVVVDFWGTWCPRCREQLPQVLSLARANESRGVKLLTVALERPDDLPLAVKFLADQAYVPPTVASVHGRSGKSCREFGIDECSVPFYRVYDRKGNEVGTIAGIEFADTRLLELVDAAVKGVSPKSP